MDRKLRVLLLRILIISQILPSILFATNSVPRTVEEAVRLLKQQWLSKEELEWIVRNPQGNVGAELYLTLGTAIRNDWKLWGGNTDLLKSCGTNDAEECSGMILGRLWESVRADAADPEFVKSLDCQFQLIDHIQVRYKGFYKLRLGEILKSLQQQIDSQLPEIAPRLTGCKSDLRLVTRGDPDLNCWSRAEFSEDGKDPVSLGELLGWLPWRNGASVFHSPPNIELRFHKRCSWPTLPVEFAPPEVRRQKP